jgi:aminoglycoside phosphotransferase (APT) family kinase protein
MPGWGGKVPEGPAQLTPAMLTEALRPAAVTGVRWERIGQGFGFTGLVVRLHLTYTNENAGPPTLVAKFPVNSAKHSVHREAWFYRVLAPQLPTPAPRCVAIASDEEQGKLVLLLEDVRPARGGDALLGCSPDDVAAVLSAIAPVHAAWWARPDRLAELPDWTGDHIARQARYRERWAAFTERDDLHLDSRLRRMASRLGDGLAEVLGRLDAAPQTVVHADLHLDNVLFTQDEHRRVVVLDWQTVCRGPAAVDLVKAIMAALSPEDRREHEGRLLAEYGRVEHRDYALALIVYFAGVIGWQAGNAPSADTGREAALRRAALGDGRLVSALLDHDADTLF